MTYAEAVEFRDKNIEIVGKHSNFLQHKIEYLLIAPFDIAEPDIVKVYKRALDNAGNELALRNLGFFNGSMDVYVIWEPVPGQVEQMRLVSYLAAVGQKA